MKWCMPFWMIVAHHVMGMGFTIIVQPDALADEPPSVDFCTQQGLVASNNTNNNNNNGGTNTNNTNGGGGGGGGSSSSPYHKNTIGSGLSALVLMMLIILNVM
jgi:hypothetical protein